MSKYLTFHHIYRWHKKPMSWLNWYLDRGRVTLIHAIDAVGRDGVRVVTYIDAVERKQLRQISWRRVI